MATKKQFRNVSDLVRQKSSPKFAAEFDEHVAGRAIGKSLFALRARNGLSQKDLAEKMGCSQSRVSKLETSPDAGIRLGDLDRYLGALGMEIRLAVTNRGQRLAITSQDFHPLPSPTEPSENKPSHKRRSSHALS